jgi:predicted SAM-dependent methyltransferase
MPGIKNINQLLKRLENEDIILELGGKNSERNNGWIVLDNNESCDIVHDLKKPLPFPDNTFPKIYSSHTLEHFYYNELINLLKEVHRIMKDGGTFSICVPNASIYLMAYFQPDHFNAEFYCRFQPAFNFHSKIDYVNYIAYMNGYHKFMFDEENLPNILKSIGFKNIRKRDFDPKIDFKRRDYESLYFLAGK